MVEAFQKTYIRSPHYDFFYHGFFSLKPWLLEVLIGSELNVHVELSIEDLVHKSLANVFIIRSLTRRSDKHVFKNPHWETLFGVHL